MKTNTKTGKVVGLGLFTAIVVVLQLLGSFIKFGPFSITLVLAPIVIGAALYGIGAGAYLGLVFGVTVLISGDAAAFLTINPIGTVIIVLLKGMLAGLSAGMVYSLVQKADYARRNHPIFHDYTGSKSTCFDFGCHGRER